MMAEDCSARFNVGDRVRIVDAPVYNGTFGWSEYMDEFLGMETEIVGVCWLSHYGAYEYSIKADDQEWAWCEEFFVIDEPDIEEVDRPIESLFGGEN